LRKQNEIEDEVMRGQQARLHSVQAQVQAQVQSTQARLPTVPPSRSMLKRLVLVLTVFSSGADGSGLQAARAGPVHLTASLERLAHWSRSSPLDRLQRSSGSHTGAARVHLTASSARAGGVHLTGSLAAEGCVHPSMGHLLRSMLRPKLDLSISLSLSISLGTASCLCFLE
jgi:hypothetical protein